MGASTILYRGIEKIMNSQTGTLDDKKEKLGGLLVQSGFMLPVELIEDLYDFYLNTPDFKSDTLESLRDLAYHLVDVADLFDMDYDNKKDSLKLEEWIVIKDLFSTHAADIDDELLTYVMQYVVEKGVFR